MSRYRQTSMPVGNCQSKERRYYVIDIDECEVEKEFDDMEPQDWSEQCGYGRRLGYEIKLKKVLT